MALPVDWDGSVVALVGMASPCLLVRSNPMELCPVTVLLGFIFSALAVAAANVDAI